MSIFAAKPATATRDEAVALEAYREPANRSKRTSQVAAELMRHERVAIRLIVEDLRPHPGMTAAEYRERLLRTLDKRGQ